MSDPTSSAAAHAETDAHHASICKACGADAKAGCTCGNRIQSLERTVRRIRFALWIALFIALLFLAFVVGQKVQTRRDMPAKNSMGQLDQRPRMPRRQQVRGAVQGGQMPGPMNGMTNRGGNPDLRSHGFQDNDSGPNGDHPMWQPNQRDGRPNPPPPPMNAN